MAKGQFLEPRVQLIRHSIDSRAAPAWFARPVFWGLLPFIRTSEPNFQGSAGTIRGNSEAMGVVGMNIRVRQKMRGAISNRKNNAIAGERRIIGRS